MSKNGLVNGLQRLGLSHGGRLDLLLLSNQDQRGYGVDAVYSGDGFLFDKNGNGMIDDNTEMMSESMNTETKSSKTGLRNLPSTSIPMTTVW